MRNILITIFRLLLYATSTLIIEQMFAARNSGILVYEIVV